VKEEGGKCIPPLRAVEGDPESPVFPFGEQQLIVHSSLLVRSPSFPTIFATRIICFPGFREGMGLFEKFGHLSLPPGFSRFFRNQENLIPQFLGRLAELLDCGFPDKSLRGSFP
jgi:hypothetical protein